MSQADLELLISQRHGASCGVTLRFRHPSTGQDKALSASWTLEEAALRSREHDPAAYGEELAAQLLAGSGARSFLDQALAVAASSEAEWEKAGSWVGRETSRQGNKAEKRRYPWGGEWMDGRCNAAGSGTTAVTAHPAGASAFGVEDLLGNVQEWTRSLWGSQVSLPEFGYPCDPSDGREVTDPSKLPAQARLVHRGGSFKSTPTELRCSARGNALPDSKIAWRGFRVAMMLDSRYHNPCL